MQSFKSMQLPYLLANIRRQEFTGLIHIETQSSPHPRTRVVAFYKGWMTFAGEHLLNGPEFAQLLARKFNLKVIDSALHLAEKKVVDKRLIADYLQLFIRLELFDWQQVESFMESRILRMLEPVIPYDGTMIPDTDTLFDLHYSDARPGFRWADLQPIYKKRLQRWNALAPVIPSMEAIPQIVDMTQADDAATQHAKQWINGQRSLIAISIATEEDPLALAQIYYKWTQNGWISFGSGDPTTKPKTEAPSAAAGTTEENDPNRPIVLSVDDSPVVQTLIKRAIHDRYQVLLANNAVDALNILNNNKVSLALLDVTMPDIDGLELCRTIRSIGKFHDLPVVMLTAKDGMFDKLKGQMSGATHYLTKPITREKLLEVLERYVPAAVKPEV